MDSLNYKFTYLQSCSDEDKKYGKITCTIKEDTKEVWFKAEDVCRHLNLDEKEIKNFASFEKQCFNISYYLSYPYLYNKEEWFEPEERSIYINLLGICRLLNKVSSTESKVYKFWIYKIVIPFVHREYQEAVYIYTKKRKKEYSAKYVTLVNENIELKSTIAKLKLLNKQNASSEIQISDKITYADFLEKRKYYLISSSTLAADFDISARKLNKILAEENIIYKDDMGRWHINKIYADKGYSEEEKYKYGVGYTITLKWTKEGCLFVADILEKYKMYPTVEKDKSIFRNNTSEVISAVVNVNYPI